MRQEEETLQQSLERLQTDAVWSPMTSSPHDDVARHARRRRATRLALGLGLTSVAAGLIWASRLGATPDWSSWSDRGAALLIAGGAAVALVAAIVLIVRRREQQSAEAASLATDVEWPPGVGTSPQPLAVEAERHRTSSSARTFTRPFTITKKGYLPAEVDQFWVRVDERPAEELLSVKFTTSRPGYSRDEVDGALWALFELAEARMEAEDEPPA